ncbi:MAG: alpha/beta hydrolase [Pirellulales bacterium]|nr:alpha/beta hydrolase [Pirellulales bacterium]
MLELRGWGVCCVLLLGSLPGWARADEEGEIEPVPYQVIEDVVYGNKDGLGLTLDVLTPERNPKGLGLVLVASGSWHSDKSNVMAENTKRRTGEHWVQGLLQGGYTLFVVRHGSAPRYFVPEMVDDIRRSVRFVRHHAARYGVAPDRLAITSGSSGGHLSLMVGLTGDDGRPDDPDEIERESSRTQAIVAWFPPTDLVNFGRDEGYKTIEKLRPKLFQEMFGKIEDLPAQLRSISPIEQISPDDPPVLLLHGDKDLTVPLQQSKVFAEKYAAAGREVKLIVHPGGGHSWWPGIMQDYPAVWQWLDEHLQPAPASP